MNTKVRIGLIGMGRIRKLHGENLVKSVANTELVSIADPSIDAVFIC